MREVAVTVTLSSRAGGKAEAGRALLHKLRRVRTVGVKRWILKMRMREV
jgi:hypothetical protein